MLRTGLGAVFLGSWTKTNSACLPRKLSITERATRFRTTSRSSPFLTRSPGIKNTEVSN
jgi:hypothetical protein